MKIFKFGIFSVVGVLVFSPVLALGAIKFNYSQLADKDLDEMNQMVVAKVAESKKVSDDSSTEEKAQPLVDAVMFILSRPDNSDNLVDKLLSLAKNPLEDLSAWESSVTTLVDEALAKLKAPEDVNVKDQATYTVMLENLMAEFKPDAKRVDAFERKVFVKIADADIKVTKECVDERKLRMMKGTSSPSAIAKRVLADIEKNEKEKAKK